MNNFKCLIFFIIIVITACNYKNSLSYPVLRIEKDSINIGSLNKGDSLSVKIPMYNVGDDILRIVSIGASCGCTSVFVEDKVLSSGDSTVLKFVYKTAESKDSGFFEKNIVVKTNCQIPFKIIKFSGNVK